MIWQNWGLVNEQGVGYFWKWYCMVWYALFPVRRSRPTTGRFLVYWGHPPSAKGVAAIEGAEAAVAGSEGTHRLMQLGFVEIRPENAADV